MKVAVKSIITLIFLLIKISSFAQNSDIFYTSDGAIKGYDPVAYFKEGKAIKGKNEFSYLWKEAKWFFLSKENLKVFQENPEKYAPQYGGYCAYGLSENHKSPTNPDAFTIVNDKLYLNYSSKVKDLWLKNKETRIIKADSLWTIIK